MFLERRIGVSTSPWSHQGQLVISVSSLSVRRFFKILCTSCLFIYSSPAQEDRGLKVFEPLVGGGTYREVFKFVRCSCLCGDTCQRVTVCGLMSLVATHSEKIKYWVVDFFCGDTLREVLNLWVVDYFLWGFHMRVHVSVETLSERFWYVVCSCFCRVFVCGLMFPRGFNMWVDNVSCGDTFREVQICGLMMCLWR